MIEDGKIRVEVSLGTTLREIERSVLVQVLALVPEKKRAAALLGISRTALYAKLERFGLFNSQQIPAGKPAGSPSPSSPNPDLSGTGSSPPGSAPRGDVA